MAKSVNTVPEVAIITRTKNRPQFLERAIQSVLAQTTEDFVHVILNDGGDKQVVEKLLAKYPDERRLVIHNKESAGLSGALNQAIKASKSKYICIHDDDDAWHKDRLTLGLEEHYRRGATASIVPMEIVVEDIKENGEILQVERKPHPESWCGEVSLFKQAHRNYLSNGAIMYTRAAYDEIGGYDETLPTAEDWDFGIRLMLKYNVEQVMSDVALVYYHQRPAVKDKDLGNSVHAGIREQERAITLLRNNYLRRDLQSGKFGVGYIMNQTEEYLNYVVRLEGHMNYASGEVIKKMHHLIDTDSIIQKSKQFVKRIIRK